MDFSRIASCYNSICEGQKIVNINRIATLFCRSYVGCCCVLNSNFLFSSWCILLKKLGRGEMSEDDDPFGKGTGEARDDIAAMDRQDATLVISSDIKGIFWFQKSIFKVVFFWILHNLWPHESSHSEYWLTGSFLNSDKTQLNINQVKNIMILVFVI